MYRFLAALLALPLIGYQLFVSQEVFRSLLHPETDIASGFRTGSPWPSVAYADPVAHAAGLRPGDRLLAVQGQPFTGTVDIDTALHELRPGELLRVTVHTQEGAVKDVAWPVERAVEPAAGLERYVFRITLEIFLPFLCLFIGFVTVFLRPKEKQAWLVLFMMASFAHGVVRPGSFPPELGPLRFLYRFIHAALSGAWPLAMLLFAWAFPTRVPWQRRNRWLPWVVGLTLGAMNVLMTLRSLLTYKDGLDAAAFIDAMQPLLPASLWVSLLAVTGFFMLLGAKVLYLDEHDLKRRARTLLIGTAAALTPLLLVVSISALLGIGLDSVPNLYKVPALLAMTLFPLTLAYVIVVHRIFGIRMVLRQGLRYALARRGVRVAQALLSIGILLMAAYMATLPNLNRPRIIQIIAVGAVGVILLQRLAEKASDWVDRRFFREAYDAEQVLSSLSEDVRTMVETKPLLETVAKRLSDALHVDQIALLLHNGSQFQPAYALGYGPAAAPDLSKVASVLQQSRAPLRVYLDDERSWIYREGLTEEELQWLERLHSELLLPLAVKEKLLGFISLGPKRSEEPYTRNDLRLLQSVAVQTGLALENSQLATAIAGEIAQRERLAREVEIAREVQERLFPQNLPEIEGLDYFGFCRPAQVIGGDSYDFIALDNGSLGVSIGDVSGKGIPAALLMASLQSAIRGQVMAGPRDLATMMTTLNRLIYDSSPSNRYATIFYGQYDPKSRMLTYVNGGHNPPMLVRGSQVQRLEEGGPVVGLFRPAKYVETAVAIEPGDLLIGFTDGISEAMNGKDEEWGEEALAECIRSLDGLCAREVCPKILEAADRFVAGAAQHDDMTLVIVRFLC